MSQGERILFRRFLLSVTLIVVVASALIVPKVALATPHSPSEVPQSLTTGSTRTFSETGFTVSNYFLKTWNATPNALFVYGLPISQPFIEQSFSNPGEYYRVQYFERAILEEHPENAGGPYYILGRHADMPPQPRFNTGERLTAVVLVLGTVVFGITGLAMWFLKGIMPVWLFQASVLIHDLMFIVTFAMFVAQTVLAL